MTPLPAAPVAAETTVSAAEQNGRKQPPTSTHARGNSVRARFTNAAAGAASADTAAPASGVAAHAAEATTTAAEGVPAVEAAATPAVAEAEALTAAEAAGEAAEPSVAAAAIAAAAAARETSTGTAEEIHSEAAALPATSKLFIEELFCGSPLGRDHPASLSPQKFTAAGGSAACEPPRCAVACAGETPAAAAASGEGLRLVQHGLQLLRCFAAALLRATLPEAAAADAVQEGVTAAVASAPATAAAGAAAASPAWRSTDAGSVGPTTPSHIQFQSCSNLSSSCCSPFVAASHACATPAAAEAITPAALLYLAAPAPFPDADGPLAGTKGCRRPTSPAPQPFIPLSTPQQQQHRQWQQEQSQQEQWQHQQQWQQQRQEHLLRRAGAAAAELRRLLLLLCAALPVKFGFSPQQQEEEQGCIAGAAADAEAEIGVLNGSTCACVSDRPLLLQRQRHCKQHHWALQQHVEEESLVYLQERRRDEQQLHRTAADAVTVTAVASEQNKDLLQETVFHQQQLLQQLSEAGGAREEVKHTARTRHRSSSSKIRSSGSRGSNIASAAVANGGRPTSAWERWSSSAEAEAEEVSASPTAAAAAQHTAAAADHTARGAEAASGRAEGRKGKDVSATGVRLSELRERRRLLLLRFWQKRFQQQVLLQQLERVFLFCCSVRSSPTLFSAYLLLLLCTPGDAGDMLLLSLAGFWKVCDDAEDAAAAADAAACAAVADAEAAARHTSAAVEEFPASPPAAVAAAGRSRATAHERRPAAGEGTLFQQEPMRQEGNGAAAAGRAAADDRACCCCCQWHLLRRIQCVEYVRCFVAELLPLLLWMYTSRCLLPPHKLCLMHSSLLLLSHIDIAVAASAAVSWAAAATHPGVRDAVPAAASAGAAVAAEGAAAVASGVCEYLHGVLEAPMFVEEAPDSYVGLENLLLVLAGERCSLLGAAAAAASALSAAATASMTSPPTAGEKEEAGVGAILRGLKQLTREQESTIAVAAAGAASAPGESVVSRGAAAAVAPPHTLVAAASSDVNSSACRRVQQLFAANVSTGGAAPSASKEISKLQKADAAAVAATVAAQHADAEFLLRVVMGSSGSGNNGCPGARNSNSKTTGMSDKGKQERSPDFISVFDTGDTEAAAEGGRSQSGGMTGNAPAGGAPAAATEVPLPWWGQRMLRGETVLIRRSVGFPLSRMTAQQQQQLTLRCLSTYSFYAGVCAALEKHTTEQFAAAGAAAVTCCCRCPTGLSRLRYSSTGSNRCMMSDLRSRRSSSSRCRSSSSTLSASAPLQKGAAAVFRREELSNNSSKTATTNSCRCSSSGESGRDGSSGSGCMATKRGVLAAEELKEHACSVAAAGVGWRNVSASLAAAAERGEEQVLLQPQEHLEMLTAWYLASIANSKELTPVSLRHVLPQPLLLVMLQQKQQQRLTSSSRCSRSSTSHQLDSSLMNAAQCACKACTRRTPTARRCTGSPGKRGAASPAAAGVRSLEDVRAIVAAALSEDTHGTQRNFEPQTRRLYTLEQLLNMPVDPWDAGSRAPPAAVSEGLLLQAATTLGRLLFLRQRLCFTPTLLLDKDRRSSPSSSSSLFDNSGSNCGDTGLLTDLMAVQSLQLERLGRTWRQFARQQLQMVKHPLHEQLHVQARQPLQLQASQKDHQQQHQQEQQAALLGEQEPLFPPRQEPVWRPVEAHERRQQGSSRSRLVLQRWQQHCRDSLVLSEPSASGAASLNSEPFLLQLSQGMQQQPPTPVQEPDRLLLPQQQLLRLLLLHQAEHFGCSCETVISANHLSCSALTALAAHCCLDGLGESMHHWCAEVKRLPPSSLEELQGQPQETQLNGQWQPTVWDSSVRSACSSTGTLSREATAAARVWGDAWLRQRLVREELGMALAATEKRAAAEMLLKSYWAAAALRSILN